MRARIQDDDEQYLFRVYVTDAMKMQGENMIPAHRWVDIIERKIDTRTGNEIAADVIREAGLTFKG